MNTILRPQFVIGLLLVALGVAFLAQEMFAPGFSGAVFSSTLFVVVAVVTGAAYLRNRSRWGWLFPCLISLAIAGTVFLNDAFPSASSYWSAGAVLLACGLPFLAGYAHGRQWSLLIPAGVLITLAVVAELGVLGQGAIGGAVFLLGLAATFAVVSRTNPGSLRWAFVTAIALAVLGVIALADALATSGVLWGIGLIALGAFLILRQTRWGGRSQGTGPKV